MSIEVADPARLPSMDLDKENVDPKLKIKEVNSYKLTGRKWLHRKFTRPTVIKPVGTQSGIIYWAPGKQPQTAAAAATVAELQASCYYKNVGADIPFVGECWLYLDSATDTAIREADGSTLLSVLMDLGVETQITGSAGAADVRNADTDGDFGSTLLGLEVNARMAAVQVVGGVETDWVRLSSYTPQDLIGTTWGQNVHSMSTAAALFGRDLTGGGNGIFAPLEVRNADADGDFVSTLLGALVNSRLSALGAADYVRLRADTAAVAAVDERLMHLKVQSLLRGIDSSAAAGSRSLGVEARALDNFDNISMATPVGILSSSVQFIRDAVGGNQRYVGGLKETTSTPAAAASLQMRKSGYWGGFRDRRFNITRSATGVAVSTSGFTDTDPSVLLVAPATNEWIVRRVWVRLAENTTALVRAAWVADPDNRYFSGGTSFTPSGGFRSTNRGGAGTLTPTQARYYDGATAIVATAADNDEYHSGDKMFLATSGTVCPAGAEVSWEPEDDILIPPSGSFVLYVWGESAIDFTFGIEIESANVQ